MLLIKGSILHDAIHEQPFQADILVENGKIAAIREEIPAADGMQVLDARGLQAFPGMIDAHSHIGFFGTAGNASKDDAEVGAKCAPHHRGIDGVNPMEETFHRAAAAGVTCVGVGPGSVSCVAGTFLAMKTRGNCVDQMQVKNPVAMKIAFGENPKACLKDAVASRMTIAAEIRSLLKRSAIYAEKKLAGQEPPWDEKLEAMLPVLNREIPLKAHAHRADDIFTAMRIAREFELDLTLEHVSDGALISRELQEAGYPIAYGPCLNQQKKDENKNKSVHAAAELIKKGCHVCMITDAPVIAQEYLGLQAGLLMRYGISAFDALKTVTIHAAEHLGIQDRVGSLAVGKDADIVLSRSFLLNVDALPEMVYIDGIRI